MKEEKKLSKPPLATKQPGKLPLNGVAPFKWMLNKGEIAKISKSHPELISDDMYNDIVSDRYPVRVESAIAEEIAKYQQSK